VTKKWRVHPREITPDQQCDGAANESRSAVVEGNSRGGSRTAPTADNDNDPFL
jgi:hypothetical protein